jgi:SAM-dependent methyltransferase
MMGESGEFDDMGRVLPTREFLDIEEISAEIRQRVRLISNPSVRRLPGPSSINPNWLAETDKLWRNILIGQSLIGSMPPSPPTLRGRVSRRLVQLVQRSLFWLTPQIQTFQQQVAISAREQATALRDLQERLARFDARFAETDETIVELRTELPALLQVRNTQSNLREELSALKDLVELRTREMAETGAQGRSRSETPPKRSDTVAGGASYVALQNAFRGSYEDIKNRFKIHLQHLNPTQHGSVDAPSLDLGCGRGEWLGVLREHQFCAYGVDLDPGMIGLCSQRGLMVQRDDLLGHLKGLPAGSRGSVTAFHVIEHLPATALEGFFDEILRVLAPGGVLIVETPNPANVLVGTRTFYLDPTHQQPLPAELVRFLVENRGFGNIQVVPLHPYPESAKLNLPDNPTATFIDEHFFGHQDYAVVCSKPVPPEN